MLPTIARLASYPALSFAHEPLAIVSEDPSRITPLLTQNIIRNQSSLDYLTRYIS